MTPTQRLIARFAPFQRLLAEERRRSGALRAKVAEQDATIKALRIDLAVENARWKLAQTQRDRARDLVAALLGEERQFSPGDLAWMDEHGVGAE